MIFSPDLLTSKLWVGRAHNFEIKGAEYWLKLPAFSNVCKFYHHNLGPLIYCEKCSNLAKFYFLKYFSKNRRKFIDLAINCQKRLIRSNIVNFWHILTNF